MSRLGNAEPEEESRDIGNVSLRITGGVCLQSKALRLNAKLTFLNSGP